MRLLPLAVLCRDREQFFIVSFMLRFLKSINTSTFKTKSFTKFITLPIESLLVLIWTIPFFKLLVIITKIMLQVKDSLDQNAIIPLRQNKTLSFLCILPSSVHITHVLHGFLPYIFISQYWCKIIRNSGIFDRKN